MRSEMTVGIEAKTKKKTNRNHRHTKWSDLKIILNLINRLQSTHTH